MTNLQTNLPTEALPDHVWKHEYHQSVVYKLMNARKPDRVFLTFEQSLEIIRRVHAFTRGLPQVIYLVGWQYDGHDSKYPAFYEVNSRLKRPEDETTFDSLRWLVKEAKQYNATVSLHINFDDAYDNSPLWEEYLEADLLVREKDGSLRKGGPWDDEWSYMICKTLEWRADKLLPRFERLLELLPEICEAGTIHVDALRPEGSPFHSIGVREELQTIQEILKAVRERGIEITTEYLPSMDFAGLIPLAYHFNFTEEQRLEVPTNIACGGDSTWNGRRATLDNFPGWHGNLVVPGPGCLYEEAWGANAYFEGIFNKPNFAEDIFYREFCEQNLPCLYLNSSPPTKCVQTSDVYVVDFENGTQSLVRKADRFLTISQDGRTLVEGNVEDGFSLCLPLPTKSENVEVILWSRNDQKRNFDLPPIFPICEKVFICPLTTDGPIDFEGLEIATTNNGTSVELPVKARTPWLCTPA